MTITAKFVRDLDGFSGDARLYRLSEPIRAGYEPFDEPDERVLTHHVVVSGTVVAFSGPETYIFGADSEGEIISWAELPGSFQGSIDHAEAIRNAGWILD
jgi:hypothetical protein